MQLIVEHIQLDKDHSAFRNPGGLSTFVAGSTKLTVTASAHFGGELAAPRGAEHAIQDFISGFQPGSELLPASHFTRGQAIFEALMRLMHEIQSLVGAVYAGKPERLPYVWDSVKNELNPRASGGNVRILNDTQVMRLLTAMLAQLDAVQTSIEKNGLPK